MPKIHLNFKGSIEFAKITTAFNTYGENVDVSKMDVSELIIKLKEEELFLYLTHVMSDCDHSDAYLFNYESAE